MALTDPKDASQVAAPLTPEGDNPTHLAIHGDGGLAIVDTFPDVTAALQAIPDRCETKWFFVKADGPSGTLYRAEIDGTVTPETGLGGGSGGATGWVYVTDILPQTTEVISDKTFQDPPNNTILQTATADQPTVRVLVRSSFPLVTVNGTPATLTPAADGGHYQGTADISVPGGGAITVTQVTPDGATGATDTALLTLVTAPELTALSFTGAYPGAQTELKAGDTFQITGTTDVDATHVEVQNQDAGTSELLAIPGAPATTFTVTMTIADRGDAPQLLPAHVRARNAAGAFGSLRATNQGGGNVDGVDVVNLNDLRPSGTAGPVAYPGGQQALKDAESATVTNTASDFDTIAYTDPTGSELSITNPAVFEGAKNVTRVGGAYNVTTFNFRMTLNRAANDATTVVEAVVQIADVAPTVDVSVPAARLRSGGNNGTAPQDHTVTITADQQLLTAPSLDPDSGGNRGTFQGGAFAGGPSVWTRALRVDETVADEKGVFAFENLVATGLAGRVQNAINSGAAYTLGGFVPRNLTFAAFATTTTIGTSVEDFAKLQAGIFTATNQTALKQPIGTAPPVTNGYTVDATGVNPTSLEWLDTAAAGSNSSGTAQITNVEEVV